MPTVTVAMPTYNRAELLKGAIQSVLNQTHAAIEIVILDNASSDRTQSVVKSFNDSRIAYRRNASNVGLFRNWQNAISLTDNPYLAILQDDDLWQPNFLEASITALEQHSSAGIAITQVTGIDEQNKPVPLPDDSPPEGKVLGLDYLEGMAAGKNWVLHASSVILRTATLKSTGKFDNPHSKHSIDLNLYMRLATRADLVFIPQRLAQIRIHAGQDTQLRFRQQKGTGPLAAIAERMDAIAYLLASPRALSADYRQWLRDRLLHMSAHRSTLTAEFIPSLNLSWQEQLQVAVQEIEESIPAGDRFVLADEDQWRYELPATLSALPFTEKDGLYSGVPTDDESAIKELNRLRKNGANFFVVGWPAFWWLDYYAGLRSYLKSTFSCIFQSSRLIIFNLQKELT